MFFTPNATVDIYHVSNTVGPPDASAVPCYIKGDFVRGQEAGDRGVLQLTWTHVMLVADAVDVRDGYQGQNTQTEQDRLYLPDQATGTEFRVIFVERIPGVGKRVYLDRHTPPWPTNNL